MQFVSVLFLLAALNGIFLVFVLLVKSKKIVRENLFLALMLVIVSGYLFREYLILEGHFETFPHLMAVFIPLLYLIGPVYYFYIKCSLQGAWCFKKVDFLHLLPAMLCFLTILPFYLKSSAEKLALYRAPQPGDFDLDTNRIFYYGFLLLLSFIYGGKSLQLVNLKFNHSDGRSTKLLKGKMLWLRSYTHVFLFFLFCFLIAFLLILFTEFYPYYVMIGTVLAFSLLIHFVSYWAIRESNITTNNAIKSQKPALPKHKVEELKIRILSYLEEEKVFLDSDLTSRYFCDRLSINSKYLSQLINSEFNCNLTYLINSYRVEEAKKMINDPKFSHLNFLGIATRVGFNTKNTFTRTFKRHTGYTPSAYKNGLL